MNHFLPALFLLLISFLSSTILAQQQEVNHPLELGRMVAQNEVFNEGFTGFLLLDPESGRELYNFRADKFFTPASNTKLFTFYLADRVLRGRAPAVRFRETEDEIYLLGTGYPLLFHPSFKDYDELSPWLAQQTKGLVLYHNPEQSVPRYGDGWSWDDYNYGYVYERSALPVYGNSLRIMREAGDTGVIISPPQFTSRLHVQEQQRRRAFRSESLNDFKVAKRIFKQQSFEVRQSLVTSPALTVELINETLGKNVTLLEGPDTLLPEIQPGYFEVSLKDTVYRTLLRESDNFLAEQLLLLAASKRYAEPDLGQLLTYAKDTLLTELDLSRRQWVDGSGLSRYNQFTPRQLGGLLQRMYREMPLKD